MNSYKEHPSFIKFYSELEKQRKKYKSHVLLFVALFFICFLVSLIHLILQEHVYENYYFSNISPWIIKIIGTLSLVFLIIGIFILEDYKLYAKNSFQNIVNDLYFEKSLKLPKDKTYRDKYEHYFYEANIFSKQDLLSTDRYVELKNIKGISFNYTLSDIYFACSGSSNKHPNQIVSQGIFTVIERNMNSNTIYIIEKERNIFKAPRKSMLLSKRILTGNKRFDKRFRVYAKSKQDIKDTLTPELMDKLCVLSKQTKSNIYISFNNNKIFLVVECPKKIRLPLLSPINKNMMDSVDAMMTIPEELTFKNI